MPFSCPKKIKRGEDNDLNIVYFVSNLYIVGSRNYMRGPKSSFSILLDTQPILDYSETIPVCGILPAFHCNGE